MSRVTVRLLTDPSFTENEIVLKSIYTKNYRGVEQYIMKNNGNAEDARDIYQEAFLATWRNIKLERFLPSGENDYSAYLFRIAKNKWIDHLRAHKNKRTVELVEDRTEEADTEETGEVNRYIDQVKTQFDRLGERCRELLSLFYYKKISLRKISERFSWTEASAKNNKYRCLKQLRELVVKEGNTHE